MLKRSLEGSDNVHRAGIKSPRSTILSSSSLKYKNSMRLLLSVHEYEQPLLQEKILLN